MLQFEGDGFSVPNLASVRVYFMSIGTTFNPLDPQEYGCQVVFANTTHIQCLTSAGVGANLVFVAMFSGFPSSPSYDTLSYAAPTLKSGTLRVLDGPPTTSLVVCFAVRVFCAVLYMTCVDMNSIVLCLFLLFSYRLCLVSS